MDRLRDKVTIVTGAARGLGEAIALRFAQEGAHVVLVDMDKSVHDTAAALVANGYRCEAKTLDVADPDAVATVVAEVVERRGRLDVVVNNAGISPKRNGQKYLVDEMDLEGWNKVQSVNMTSVFLFSKACIRYMKEAGSGRIINISSQAARTRPLNTSAHYAASKAAILGFSRALANEVGEYGVTVNCIAPGLIETAMFKAFSAERREASIKQVPLKRMGRPADVAAAAAFLASEDGGYLTGTTIDVNGGLFMT